MQGFKFFSRFQEFLTKSCMELEIILQFLLYILIEVQMYPELFWRSIINRSRQKST